MFGFYQREVKIYMKKKTCLIIYNPRSGKGKVKEKIDIYEKILKENGYEVDIVGTKGVGYATEAVVEAEYHDIVFAVGGDGTLNEVVRGNLLSAHYQVVHVTM